MRRAKLFSISAAAFLTFGATMSVSAVDITMLNTKGEIQAQLEAAAKVFAQDNPGINLTIIPAGAGQSPFQIVMALYASGNAPTLAMLDPADMPKLADKFIDLKGEKWVNDTTDDVAGMKTPDGRYVGFPFAVEGYSFIYNKNVLDKAGVDPSKVRTTKDLEAAFKKVEASGKGALVISPMDWSLAAHFLGIGYSDTAKTQPELDKLVAELRTGKYNFAKAPVFNGLLDTFDVMRAYNVAKKDPLSVTYEKGPELLGKGEIGFWFMGNWAWPQISSFAADQTAFGFMPVPVSNDPSDPNNNGIPISVTKRIGIDKSQNSAEQQAAAKKFLDWLVYTDHGQDALVNQASVIPAFKNFSVQPKDPLAKSIGEYLNSHHNLFAVTTLPADHWSKVGASMQKYLVGRSKRAVLFREINAYWKTVK